MSTNLFAATRQEKIEGHKWLVGSWKIKADPSVISDTGPGWLVFLPQGKLTMTEGNDNAPVFELLIVAGDGKSAKRVDFYVNNGPAKAAPATSVYFLFENAPQSRDERFFGKKSDGNEFLFILDQDKKTLKIGGLPIAQKCDEPAEVTAIIKKLEAAK